MTDLATVYGSGHQEAVHCLSITHPDLPGGGEHWVFGWQDLVAGLETSVVQRFRAAWIKASLPQRGAVGQQKLSFSVSNVTGRVRRYVEQVRMSTDDALVTYRAYVPGQFDAPARIYRMTLLTVSTKAGMAELISVFKDSVNAKFPSAIYTQARFRGLAHFGG